MAEDLNHKSLGWEKWQEKLVQMATLCHPVPGVLING
jgi:hypothetical protein